MKNYLFVLIPLFLGLGVPSLRAQTSQPTTREGRLDLFLKDLNLSSEQKVRIKALREKSEITIKSLREKAIVNRKKMREAYEKNASSSVMRTTRSDMHMSQRAVSDARFEQLLAIREVLTPVQKIKLNEWQLKDQVRNVGDGDSRDPGDKD